MSGFFSYAEETSQYHAWSFEEDGEHSKLYICRWRVPTPTPRVIEVSVRFEGEYEYENNLEKDRYTSHPEQKNAPIIVFVNKVSDHNKTARFAPGFKDQPFTSIYVPWSFLEGHEDSERIQVIVKWGK